MRGDGGDDDADGEDDEVGVETGHGRSVGGVSGRGRGRGLHHKGVRRLRAFYVAVVRA